MAQQQNSSTKKLFKHSTIYAVGNISRQLVGFLMLPIYTKYLSPADYGVVGLLTFAIAIMEPFFGARFTDAMLKLYHDDRYQERRNVVISTALTFTTVASLLVVLAIATLQDPAATLLFGTNAHASAIAIFGITFLAQPLEYYGLTYLRILQKPWAFITISLSKLVIQLTLNITLVVHLEMGIMGVVISGVLSSSIYALALSIYVLAKNGVGFNSQIAKQMLIFSWPLWLASIASLYIYSANRYYIRLFGSLDQVGLYELAVKFGNILSFLVWTPFSQYWETERFKAYESDHAQATFRTIFKFALTLLAFVTLGISLFADPIIQIMASAEFHEAGKAVPMLTLAFLFSCLTNFVNFSFLVKEKTKTIGKISYLTAAIVTLFNFLLIPIYGFVGAAIALMIALFSQFLVTLYLSRNIFDMGVRLIPTGKILLIVTVAYVICVQFLTLNNLLADILLRSAVIIVLIPALLIVSFGYPSIRLYSTKAYQYLWGRLAPKTKPTHDHEK